MLPAMIKSHFLLCLYVFTSQCAANALSSKVPDDAFQKRQTPATTPLVDFQVYEPVLTPSGTSDQYGCIYTQTLMSYVFSNSYGAPFVGRPSLSTSPNEGNLITVLRVGDYTPPPCSFNRVTMNFTATSHGRQFDRLGLMYLGSVEVWRTSTAEPTADGIIWTYIKYNGFHFPFQKSQAEQSIQGDGTIQCFMAERAKDYLRSGKYCGQYLHGTLFHHIDRDILYNSGLPL